MGSLKCRLNFQLSFNLVEFSGKLSYCRILGLNFQLLFNLVEFSVKLSFKTTFS